MVAWGRGRLLCWRRKEATAVTIGQRIAQKRKELALSQEALGDQLGVSRQSIYKWESDTALPEIDKLIALSRLYGVSVGWLLGVEDLPEPPGEAAGTEAALTEQQLRMVEEIASRYIAAQPKPRKRRRWPLSNRWRSPSCPEAADTAVLG